VPSGASATQRSGLAIGFIYFNDELVAGWVSPKHCCSICAVIAGAPDRFFNVRRGRGLLIDLVERQGSASFDRMSLEGSSLASMRQSCAATRLDYVGSRPITCAYRCVGQYVLAMVLLRRCGGLSRPASAVKRHDDVAMWRCL
jgi:hypothetical protein